MIRFSPFVRINTSGRYPIIVSPKTHVELTAEAYQFVSEGGVKDDCPEELMDFLVNQGIIETASNPTAQTLQKLDSYFLAMGINLRVVKKGSQNNAYRLSMHGYVCEGEGFGLDQIDGTAITKAVVEYYERYSCSRERNQALIHRGSGVSRVFPDLFADFQYTISKFPYTREPSDFWVTATTLDDVRIDVPLEYVCFPDDLRGSRCTAASSNGVASHTDHDQARIRSLCELIERDALMIHWFNQISKPRILPPTRFKERIDNLKRLGYSVSFYDYKLDLLPVVLCVISRNWNEYPRHILGASCHVDETEAISKALSEVELNVTFAGSDIEIPKSQSQIVNIMDHQFWYDSPENRAEFDYLWDGSYRPVNPPTVNETSRSLESLLTKAGLSWYTIKLNEPGYRQTDVHTVRSVVPGLTSIGFGYMMEPLGGSRLSRIPKDLGFKSNPTRMTQQGYRVQPFS